MNCELATKIIPTHEGVFKLYAKSRVTIFYGVSVIKNVCQALNLFVKGVLGRCILRGLFNGHTSFLHFKGLVATFICFGGWVRAFVL